MCQHIMQSLLDSLLIMSNKQRFHTRLRRQTSRWGWEYGSNGEMSELPRKWRFLVNQHKRFPVKSFTICSHETFSPKISLWTVWPNHQATRGLPSMHLFAISACTVSKMSASVVRFALYKSSSYPSASASSSASQSSSLVGSTRMSLFGVPPQLEPPCRSCKEVLITARNSTTDSLCSEEHNGPATNSGETARRSSGTV